MSNQNEGLREYQRNVQDCIFRTLIDRNLSQAKFADICDLSRTTMNSVIAGKSDISFLTLVKIAEGIGISIVELLTDGKVVDLKKVTGIEAEIASGEYKCLIDIARSTPNVAITLAFKSGFNAGVKEVTRGMGTVKNEENESNRADLRQISRCCTRQS